MDHEFLKKEIIKIDEAFLQEIKKRARERPSGKYRYCLHASEDSSMQEMIIAIGSKDQYHPPDKHDYCAETKIILDGEAYIVLFEEDGGIRELFRVSPDALRSCRVEKGIYHAVWPISEQVVFYEVRAGQNRAGATVFPPWAPRDGVTSEQIRSYKAYIEQAIRDHMAIDGA